MSRQSWVETLAVAVANGTAIASSSTETIIFPDITIPATYLQDGRLLKVRVFGQYSNTGTPTLTFAVRWGGVSGTLLATSAACTTPSGVTAAMFEFEVWLQVRTNGATGTIMANGVAKVFAAVAGTVASATGEGLVTPMSAGGVTTPAAVTVDLTVDTALSVTAKWSASSSSNTLTGLQYELVSMN